MSRSALGGLAAVVAPAVLVLAGCGSSGSAAAPPRSPSATTAACPGASTAPGVRRWPAPLPTDFPPPPRSSAPRLVQTNAVLTVVGLQTATSLRESVIFVLRELPKHGFTLGRGDAEAGQADAPFVRGGVFGQLRLNFDGPCRTQWLIAIGAPRQGTSPLLPPPSASPTTVLPPFGG